MLAIGGILVAAILWMMAMWGITWTWNRHVPIVMAAGFEVEEKYRRIDLKRVARRHTLGWTAFFVGLFLVMALSNFPLWQRLGIAVLLSVFYGLSRIRRGEVHWVGRSEPQRTAMFGKVRDRIWYRILAVAEWTGYLCAIVFATDLVGQII
jgi:hypothetical protein